MKNKNTGSKGFAAITAPQPRTKRAKNELNANQISQASITNPPMTEQIVVPPSHIWNKIENILNQQDQAKALANTATVLTLANDLKAGKKKHPMYFTTFGITILLCIVFIAL